MNKKTSHVIMLREINEYEVKPCSIFILLLS